MRGGPRWATVLAASLVSGCTFSLWGEGANDEDRHRLAVLGAEPAAMLVPPDVVVIEGPTDILATSDNAQLSGCCTSAVAWRFEIDVDPAVTMRWYVDQLEQLGWQEVMVDCRSRTMQVSALKRFDSFVGRFRAEISYTGPPQALFQSASARFHTEDNPEPTGRPTNDVCLATFATP